MTAPHGPSGLPGSVSMQCLTGLPDCDDWIDCVCRCHDMPQRGEPVCGATNTTLGLTCGRRPHPPGTAHYQDDGNAVRAWGFDLTASIDLSKEEDHG